MSATTQEVQGETTLRNVRPEDGADLWRIVRACKPLDENSAYAYMLWAREFGDTSLVAERDGEAIGFAAAFRPPARPDSLFLWQIAVGPEGRGEGLASRLLDALIQVPGDPVRFLEATVDPGNEPSRNLFSSFARRYNARLKEEPYIQAEDFPEAGHPPEPKIRIGPLDEVVA